MKLTVKELRFLIEEGLELDEGAWDTIRQALSKNNVENPFLAHAKKATGGDESAMRLIAQRIPSNSYHKVKNLMMNPKAKASDEDVADAIQQFDRAHRLHNKRKTERGGNVNQK